MHGIYACERRVKEGTMHGIYVWKKGTGEDEDGDGDTIKT